MHVCANSWQILSRAQTVKSEAPWIPLNVACYSGWALANYSQKITYSFILQFEVRSILGALWYHILPTKKVSQWLFLGVVPIFLRLFSKTEGHQIILGIAKLPEPNSGPLWPLCLLVHPLQWGHPLWQIHCNLSVRYIFFPPWYSYAGLVCWCSRERNILWLICRRPGWNSPRKKVLNCCIDENVIISYIKKYFTSDANSLK